MHHRQYTVTFMMVNEQQLVGQKWRRQDENEHEKSNNACSNVRDLSRRSHFSLFTIIDWERPYDSRAAMNNRKSIVSGIVLFGKTLNRKREHSEPLAKCPLVAKL